MLFERSAKKYRRTEDSVGGWVWSGAESESIVAVEVIGDLGVIREHHDLMIAFPVARLEEKCESGRADEKW